MIRNPFRARWAVYAPGRRPNLFMTRFGADSFAHYLTHPPSGQAYASNWVTVERLP